MSKHISNILIPDVDSVVNKADEQQDVPINTNEDETTFKPTLGIPSGMSIVISMMLGSGIFSTPGFVWQLVGSPGMAIVMWIVGGIISYMGVLCFIELGTMLPRNGGEQVYLDYAYRKPRKLFPFIFCWCTILCLQPSGTAANAIVVGKYILYAIYGNVNDLTDSSLKEHFDWYARGIALLAASSIILICALSTKWSLRIQTMMTSVKLVIMLLFAITGIVLLVSNNASNISNPGNWHAMFSGTSTSVNNYTTAMFNVFWAYGGWSGINSCAGELRNPRHTLPIASFGGLTVVMILYLLVNAAYITIVPAKLAFESREILAGTFSSIVFGLYFGRVILPLLIAINTYGQLVGHIFTSSRIIQMAAKEGYLPLARLFSRVNPTTNTPIYALALNWTLFVLVLFVTPLGNAFSFLLNMTGYPNSLFTLFTVMCVLILRRIEPERERPFRVWWIVPVIFITGFFHPICAVSLLFL